MAKKLTKKKEYYLSTAGLTFKIGLLPTQQIQHKKVFEGFIEDMWGKGGFLLEKKRKSDFEILVTPEVSDVPFFEKEKETYYFSWKLDWENKKAETYYHLSPYLLGNLIKEILLGLLEDKGLMLHASFCIDDKGNGFIFLAPPGGGKTTTADLLSSEKSIKKVGDDILIIRKMGNNWRFFSPPFIEKEKAPIFVWTSKAKLFFVKKAKTCAKRKLEKEDTLRKFLAQVWLRKGEVDQSTLSITTEFLNENVFFELKNCLNPKNLKRVVYED